MSVSLVPSLSPPPKIGVVSKHAHCKNHMKALQKDGYDVVELGPGPTSIPDSIDLVVLRTESCSHKGSDTAFAWSRETGKRLIVENGITGIRRALSPEAMELPRLQRALALLRQDRPDDSPSKIQAALLSMGASPTILAALIPTESQEFSMVLFPTPYPPDTKWARAIPETRIREQAALGLQVFNRVEDDIKTLIRDFFLENMHGPEPYFPSKSTLRKHKIQQLHPLVGKPLQFFTFFFLCLPEDQGYQRLHAQRVYESFSGKRNDVRVIDAAAWATGRRVYLTPKVCNQVEAPQVEAPQVEAQPPRPVLVEDLIQKLRDDLEGEILLLMEQGAVLKGENTSLRSTLDDHSSRALAQAESIRFLRDDLKKALEADMKSQGEISSLRGEIQILQARNDAKDAQVVITGDLTSGSGGVIDAVPQDSLIEALKALKATGANVTLEIKI